MNVLVTGHRGFIGRAVTKELVRRGHWVRLFSGDVRDDNAVSKQVHHYDVVVHLAAKTPGGATPVSFEEMVDHNLGGAIKVAMACEDAGKPMLFAATRVTEGPYGRSKAMAEQIVREEYGATAIRVSMAYGPGQTPPPPYGDGPMRLVPNWICRALLGGPITIWGDPSCVPDLVYIDDVSELYADYVEFVHRHDNLKGSAVDCAGPGRHPLSDIALFVQQEVERQTGLTSPIGMLGAGDLGPPPGPAGNGVPFSVGLRRTVHYYRALLDL